MNTLPFSEMVELNPRVRIENGKEYPFVEMSVLEPNRRYVEANQTRTFQSGGAKFLSGDTLFARITPCLENGKIAQYKAPQGHAGFGSTEFIVMRARPEVSIPGFVYYLSKSDIIRKPAEKSMSGASGRQRADTKSIVDIVVPCPPLQTQRKIAAILTAYDDLIENNLRRIKILEEMAQNLYREWFVKFRFPGHENARFVDSPLGRIPEGWVIKKLLSAADVAYGFAFKSSMFNTQKRGSPIVRIRDVLEGKSSTYSLEEVDPKYRVLNGDILVGMDGDFHIGFWIGGQANLVQRVARFRPNGNVGRFYLYFLLLDPIQKLNAAITGTTVAHLGHMHIKIIDVILPNDYILGVFNSMQEPILAEILNLRIKNSNLQSTRELLLPKLISGELDVSELGITVPEEVRT